MELFFYFIPLAIVISLVCSGTRREEFDEILIGALKLFAYMTAGTLVFSAMLQFTYRIPFLFYTALACLLSVLGYYVLKEFAGFARGKKKEGGEKIAGQ